MEKRIKKIWTAGFFLPAINATVFSWRSNNYKKHQNLIEIEANKLVQNNVHNY